MEKQPIRHERSEQNKRNEREVFRPETIQVPKDLLKEILTANTEKTDQERIEEIRTSLNLLIAEQADRGQIERHSISVRKIASEPGRNAEGQEIDDSSMWRDAKGRFVSKRQRASLEEVYKESMQRSDGFERHIFVSDHQIPDQDDKLIKAVHKFTKDFAPDKFHIVGDFLNFTAVSKYDQDPYYHKNMADEIRIGRQVLGDIVKTVKKANPEGQVIWYEGNHENRLIKYMGRNASALAEITDTDGEIINSIPHIFGLKDMGVIWVPMMQRHTEPGGVEVEHGDSVRAKAGHTAHAMLDRRGKSGISGHTHRLAMVFRTQTDEQKFWIENGSMCKKDFESPYSRSPDWQQGFSVGIYDKKDEVFHPSIVPVIKGSFQFGGKIYK